MELSPEGLGEALSDYIGIPLPLHPIASKVRPQPDGTGATDLHPNVERLCRKMWESFAGCPELRANPRDHGSPMPPDRPQPMNWLREHSPRPGRMPRDECGRGGNRIVRRDPATHQRKPVRFASVP